jgi:hydroxyproline transporter system substrate-binding protein|tara:strand:+ start:104880 stop:105767 length:888 start_codon:yes stop_codon:yes gene_type:complete|eukprot:TRINITY_DN16292_c0_g1_i1.p1 TRINITY_DN16292_c0_g1~~TRINITY_DN16292_c0_g1_i1.p1  ORF type:complete len:296 (+),score=52.19 TRINITY_DN16292_c0_g1_i1:76-963(+)
MTAIAPVFWLYNQTKLQGSHMKNTTVLGAFGALALLGATLATPAAADKLDDVLGSGKLRCAVVLDFPPMGYRDANNDPAGMDVDICHDLATRMGVEAEVVGVTWAERIPSLISGRTDVAIASSSDSLERAQTVGFTIPYMVFQFQSLLPADSEITEWDQLQDANVGVAVGTTYESELTDYSAANWPDGKGKITTFQAENDTYLAVSQGRVEAGIATDTAIANILQSDSFSNLKAGPVAPFGADIVGFMTERNEFGWINYLNLYINHAYRDGTLGDLYTKHIGGEMPDLTTLGVYY